MRMTRVAVALGLLAAGCGSDSGPVPTIPASTRGALLAVQDCADLERTMRALLIRAMDEKLAAHQAEALRDDCHMDSPNRSIAAPVDGPARVSSTNNQVAEVDEPDLVKHDSKHIYAATNGAFRILQAWPPAETREVARVQLSGTPRRLFVLGDRALVYSSLLPDQLPYDYIYCAGDGCFGGDGYPTRIAVLDISDRSRPRLIRELKISGSFVSARRIGTTVHTVLSSQNDFFESLDLWPDDIESACGRTLNRPLQVSLQFAALREKNTRIINETPLLELVPSVLDTIFAGGRTESISGRCQGYLAAQDGVRFTTILTLDMAAETPASSTTVFSRTGPVYFSPTAMYLGALHYGLPDGSWGQETNVHRFALSRDGAAYRGSGAVKGVVLNQFAMDEWQGHLRIVTTTTTLQGGSHSTLTVLAPGSAGLEAVGEVDHLAPNETVYAARFDGARGYVVTFEQRDPLFVFDLEDPRRPRLLSELIVPGFSTYLHLMDPGHLLTIGSDNGWGVLNGVRLQIFDVADPAESRLQHKEMVGAWGTHSEALTSHLAFNYFPASGLLALPMTICEDEASSFNGLMVYDVTAAGGFKLRGKVSHSGPTLCDWDYWRPDDELETVRRSVIMDDHVFSVSRRTLKVSDLNRLGEEVAVVTFGD